MEPSRCHIVITDRNSRVRNLLHRELRAEGYRVTVAEDAYGLLQLLLSSEGIDLLILDPDISGYKRAEINSRLSEISRPPVILHALSESEDQGPEHAAAKVEKIGELDTLKSAVRRTLAEKTDEENAESTADRRDSNVR